MPWSARSGNFLAAFPEAIAKMSQFVQVITTVGSHGEAERIAAQLVDDHLAACVQIIGPVSSTFHWQEEIEMSHEWLCLVKTTRDCFPAVERQIRAMHSYELPEIIALPIIAGSSDYLAWIDREVAPKRRRSILHPCRQMRPVLPTNAIILASTSPHSLSRRGQRLRRSFLATPLIVAIALLASSPAAALAGEPNPAAGPPSRGQIDGWVTDLDASSFATREAATRQLIQAGIAALPLLAELGDTAGTQSAASLERIDRTLSILSAWCAEGNPRDRGRRAGGDRAADRFGRRAAGPSCPRNVGPRARLAAAACHQAKIERLGATVQCDDGADADAVGDVRRSRRRPGDYRPPDLRPGAAATRALPRWPRFPACTSFRSKIPASPMPRCPHLAGLTQLERLYLGPSQMHAVGCATWPACRRCGIFRCAGCRWPARPTSNWPS